MVRNHFVWKRILFLSMALNLSQRKDSWKLENELLQKLHESFLQLSALLNNRKRPHSTSNSLVASNIWHNYHACAKQVKILNSNGKLDFVQARWDLAWICASRRKRGNFKAKESHSIPSRVSLKLCCRYKLGLTLKHYQESSRRWLVIML